MGDGSVCCVKSKTHAGVVLYPHIFKMLHILLHWIFLQLVFAAVDRHFGTSDPSFESQLHASRIWHFHITSFQGYIRTPSSPAQTRLFPDQDYPWQFSYSYYSLLLSLSIENNTCTFLTPNTSQLLLTYCECPLHSLYLQTTSFLMTISLLIHQNVPTLPPIPLVSPTINNRTLLSCLLLAVFPMNMILPLLQEHCHLPLLQFLLLFLPLQVILPLLTLIHTMAACCLHFLQATKAYIHFHLKMVSWLPT